MYTYDGFCDGFRIESAMDGQFFFN